MTTTFLYTGDDAGEIVGHVMEFVTGAPAEVEVERVLATVLMTDIVGSTARAEGMGDAASHDLLDAHNNAVRKEFARFRGHEVNRSATASLRRLMVQRAPYAAPPQSPRPSGRLASKFVRAFTRAWSSSPTTTYAASPFILPRGSRRSPVRAKYWSAGPCAISWRVQAFASLSAEAIA